MLDPHHRVHIMPMIGELRWIYVSLKRSRRSCPLGASRVQRAF